MNRTAGASHSFDYNAANAGYALAKRRCNENLYNGISEEGADYWCSLLAVSISSMRSYRINPADVMPSA